MIRDNREYRNFTLSTPDMDGENDSYIVEGYASTFEPYVLFTENGVDYSERIMPNAFEGADFRDCIFLKDHKGTVMARTRNNTIDISVDEHGLKHRTDLSKTEAARVMYDEIRSGMYDQMSFAFTVADEEYDRATHTRIINQIKKVYDISAVSLPANPGTEIGIATRAIFDGFIKEEHLELEKRAKAIELAKARYAFLS